MLKHNGTEPSSGVRVIEELFKRGDIVSANSLKAPTSAPPKSSYSLSTVRATLSSYIWGSKQAPTLGLDDPIVPITALKSFAQRVSRLSGPVATADIYTVKTFAAEITGDNTRDAEAVIAHIVSKGEATVLFTTPTKDDPEPVLGVKLGRAAATQADRDVLRTKAALERMTKLSKHLKDSVEAEETAAVLAAKAGNKAEALLRMKKKKGLEAKLTGARAAATKLETVVMAVDEAESNREAVAALETGMASLKTVTADGVTADRVDAVAADFDEMLTEQQEVRTALEQLNQNVLDPDEADLEKELEAMMSGEKHKEEVEDATTPGGMTKEEEELMKLLGKVEITPEEATKMQDPARVAAANAASALAEVSKLGITVPVLTEEKSASKASEESDAKPQRTAIPE